MAIVKANYQPRADGKAAKAATRAARYYTFREGPDRADRRWQVSDGRTDLQYDDVKSDIWKDAKTYGYMYRVVLSTKDADIGAAGYQEVLKERFERWYFVEHHNTDFPHAHVVGFRKALFKKAELVAMRAQVLELEQARAQEQAQEEAARVEQEQAAAEVQRGRRRDHGYELD